MTQDERDIQGYLCAAKHTTQAYKLRMLEDLASWNPRLAAKVKAALEKERAQSKGPRGEAEDGKAWGEAGEGVDGD